MSNGPLGTVLGVQFAAVCQSFVAGIFFQVALPAKLLLAIESRSVRIATAEGRKPRAMERSGDWTLSRWKISVNFPMTVRYRVR